MKVYQGYAASSGLVLGQVSRVERRTESFGTGPFNPDREQRLLDRAVKTAQAELDSMAERSGPTEQAIFLFQSMMLEDEGFMNEVRFQIKAGVGAQSGSRGRPPLCRPAGSDGRQRLYAAAQRGHP